MKTFFTIALAMICAFGNAQTYTTQYPKEQVKLAEKWMKKGEWKNGFTKAVPAPTVNAVEFYIQYHRNPAQWQALFRWLQETDLLAIPGGRTPIPGTNLVCSVEDSENWCSQEDLANGKGSESHRQKIDFMYVVSGTEGFALLDHETSEGNIKYTLERDRMEYKFDASKLKQFTSIPGTFNLMFPCDWHVAKVKTNEPSQKLRVLVVKMENSL